jgi:hypothetical protein
MSIRIQGSIHAVSIASPQAATEPNASADAPSLMPASATTLASSGDVGAMIAALLLESGAASRETAKLLKDAAAAAEDAAHARKLDEMSTAADRKLGAGLAVGIGEIGQGGLGFSGAATKDDRLGAASPGAKGLGDAAKAGFDYLASSNDEEVAKADRAMTQAKRNVESAGDIDKDAKDLLRRAMSHYADYVRAKDDASKAALFRA